MIPRSYEYTIYVLINHYNLISDNRFRKHFYMINLISFLPILLFNLGNDFSCIICFIIAIQDIRINTYICRNQCLL